MLAAPGLLQVFLTLTLVCYERLGLQEISFVVLCFTSVKRAKNLVEGAICTVNSGKKKIRLAVNTLFLKCLV